MGEERINEKAKRGGYQLEGTDFWVHRAVRSDIANTIAKYWVDGKHWIGLQYLQLNQETLLVEKGRYAVERTDIIILHGRELNVFIGPEGRPHVERFGDKKVTAAQRARADEATERVWNDPDNAAYIEHERRFLIEKPWTKVYGLTPAEAVVVLRADGWWWDEDGVDEYCDPKVVRAEIADLEGRLERLREWEKRYGRAKVKGTQAG